MATDRRGTYYIPPSKNPVTTGTQVKIPSNGGTKTGTMINGIVVPNK